MLVSRSASAARWAYMASWMAAAFGQSEASATNGGQSHVATIPRGILVSAIRFVRDALNALESQEPLSPSAGVHGAANLVLASRAILPSNHEQHPESDVAALQEQLRKLLALLQENRSAPTVEDRQLVATFFSRLADLADQGLYELYAVTDEG